MVGVGGACGEVLLYFVHLHVYMLKGECKGMYKMKYISMKIIASTKKIPFNFNFINNNTTNVFIKI